MCGNLMYNRAAVNNYRGLADKLLLIVFGTISNVALGNLN
jgi:hypothetical protein